MHFMISQIMLSCLLLITARLVTLCVTTLKVILFSSSVFKTIEVTPRILQVLLNVRSTVNKEHYNLLELWILSIKFCLK